MSISPIALVADIGGTNARFALVDTALRCTYTKTYMVKNYATVFDAICDYLKDCDCACPPIIGVAVACPADVEHIVFTNSHWHFHQKQLLADLDGDTLIVMNDFVALAYAIPKLADEDLHPITINELHDKTNKKQHKANIAVLGPGTGFGVAGLVYHQHNWFPIAGEGGHMEWAPLDPLERQVQHLLLENYQRLSIERILQGRGLVILYQTICRLRTQPQQYQTVEEIVANGIKVTCPQCHATLTMYCNILGSVAGDISLLFGARGGVYFGGGIVPRLLTFIPETQMRERFERKVRMSGYNRMVPCYVIRSTLQALDGVVAALHIRGVFG